jgi:hypothetical protein
MLNDIIEEVLRDQKNADLSSEVDVKRVAEAIVDKLCNTQGTLETARTLFNPQTLGYFYHVTQELKASGDLDAVESAYNSIALIVKGYNYGTMLLALAEVMIAIVKSPAEQVTEPDTTVN